MDLKSGPEKVILCWSGGKDSAMALHALQQDAAVRVAQSNLDQVTEPVRPGGVAVAEAAVVGKHHEIKGQAIAAFVTLKSGFEPHDELKDDLKEHVVTKIGAIARPDDVLFTADLPKTRSGKIMRRLLRDIAEGRALGDTTTLADPAVVQKLKNDYEEGEA